MPSRTIGVPILSVIAEAKVFLGLAATVIAVAGPMLMPHGRLPLLMATAIVFGFTGLALFAIGRRDHRARTLAALFLVIASVFADPLVFLLSDRSSALMTIARSIMALQVDAFAPYLLWTFLLEFPRLPETRAAHASLKLALRVSLAIGLVLFTANVLLFVGALAPGARLPFAFLAHLARHGNAGLYWPLLLGLCLPTLPVMIWNARRTGAEERRRVALLLAGLLVGLVPTVVWVFLQAVWPPVGDAFPLRRAGWVIYPTLLSMPLSTAYAVVVRRALDVRVVVRRALQYALARYSAMTVAAVPIVLLAASLYRHRNDRVSDLVTTPSQLALAAVAIAGIVTLRRRSQVLARIDRLFFREQYDTRRILGELVDQCRAAEDRGRLAEILRAAIDRVLHLDSMSVLFLDEEEGAFISPVGEVRPLRANSALAERLAKSRGPLDVDLERRNVVAREIPDEELHWIVDGGFRLLLPLRDTDHDVIGLLALGEKKSELPFSSDDHALLDGAGSAAEMTMAYRNLRPRHPADAGRRSIASVAERCAAECVACRTVQPPGHDECVRCGAATAECVLPQVIGGKFLIDERIGAGAMGVVYRGMDVHLGRLVAIKTLPHLSPNEALRLRREARAMASVSHPNLATIFGAETWQGRPMLVCEYLSGGTLADRLTRGRMPAGEAIEIGLALCSVLAAVHSAGVLHRDIKPSNIGFSADGTPKLLDFGIARILTAASSGAASTLNDPAGTSDDDIAITAATESAMRGTPLYMSPEALLGALSDASFDLWSLAMVLYEAIAGCHPLIGDLKSSGVRTRIRRAQLPDIRTFVPSLEPDVAEFFRRALSAQQGERPQTADKLRAQLERLSSHSGERGPREDAGGETPAVVSGRLGLPPSLSRGERGVEA